MEIRRRKRPKNLKMSSNSNLEVEVKFLAADRSLIREKILAAGAHLEKPRTFEKNISYDNAWGGLLRKAQLLRLRQDESARLTFKGTPQDEHLSEAKVREELEIRVSDFATAALILERVGFEQRQTYEKYRETFRLGEVEILVDELPYGLFVELEGTEAGIKETAELLGFDWNQRILESYLFILTRMKAEFDLPMDDLTFDNFADVTVSAADLYRIKT